MAEHATHDRLYEAIKTNLLSFAGRRDERIDVQALADRNRVSVTPVREILFRLIGERLVALAPFGGFVPLTPEHGELASLYAWNGQHLLAAIHVLSEVVVAQATAPVARILAGGAAPEPTAVVEMLFLAIGEATGNREYVMQIQGANDRLRRARLAEARIVHHRLRELRRIVAGEVPNVKTIVRRRLIAYHRLRVEQAAQIAALI